MPNINFELNLNKHPKDVPNRALVSAHNVQLSDDLGCLQSELSIIAHTELNSLLTGKYLAGVIPCNKEFVLFVAPADYKEQLRQNPEGIYISLYRCTESLNNNFVKENPKDYQPGGTKYVENDIIEEYDNFAVKPSSFNNFIWHGGKLKGTFTYNIKTQLIIAVAESDTLTGDLIPLKTINLGKWEDTVSSFDTDLALTNEQISLNPELKIPQITNFEYVNGLAYKGWYSFFIRYKINSIDYTKWYDVGFPIFIDELEKVRLFNYFIKGYISKFINQGRTEVEAKDFIGEGVTDYISSGANTCNKTIELTIDNKNNNFSKYQIGIIQSAKDDERAFKTLDIDISETNFYEVNDLLFEKYNYYDVKNIINYKNRLYLSNYKEVIDNKSNLNELASWFYVAIKRDAFNYKEVNGATELLTLWAADASDNRSFCVIDSEHLDGTFNFFKDVSGTYQEQGFGEHIDFAIEYGSGNDPTTNVIDQLYFQFDDPAVQMPGSQSRDYDEIITIHRENEEDVKVRLHFVMWLEVDSSEQVHATIHFDFIRETTETTPEDNYHYRLKNTTLLPGETYNFYIHFVNKYGEATDGVKINIAPRTDAGGNIISYGTDNNGSVIIDGNPLDKYHIVDKTCYLYYPELIINTDLHPEDVLQQFGNYIGFFLTYEKFQKTKQFCGILSRYDFSYANNGTWNFTPDSSKDFFTKHLSLSGKAEDGKYKFRFYCTDIDTLDVIELNFTKLRVESKGFTKIRNYDTNDANDNKGENSGGITEKDSIIATNIHEYDILNAHYVGAHNFSKGNEYRGSYIEIEFVNPDAFLADMGIPKQDVIVEGQYNYSDFIFKVVLLADTKNLYLSENKILVKFTNTYYFDEMSFEDNGILDFISSEKIPIKLGLNGFCTFNTALIYNNNQVILNTGYNLFLTGGYKSYVSSTLFKVDGTNEDKNIDDNLDLPLAAYITYIDYNNYPYESRRFKTLPEIVSIRQQPISDESGQSVFEFRHATIVQPMNSIELFENKIGSQDNNIKKTYVNYTNTTISEFNKRIMRSNPIADESFENSWRTISPEAYKDITENKGNITNLVGLGTTLLVHTEHSIFMFDRDNTLQNGEGGAMQLAMPDIFDVDYKEVVASQYGACGLQDPEAWILDEFGYIFYDNDAHKIYKFASKKIDSIDGSIINFINRYKPFRLRFANDAEHNRLLVSMWYSSIKPREEQEIPNNDYSNIVLSYNYKISKWISIHDYEFDFAFNTKQKLYYCLTSYTTNITNMYVINSSNIKHNNSNNILRISYNRYMAQNNYKEPSISIMVNDSYEIMKTIEFLTWKLYKIRKINTDDLDAAFKDTSREFIKTPYSGAKIRIYNDTIDTGYIDIKTYAEVNDQIIDKRNLSVMNYKKPWWELGNWNFNYLRDIRNSKKLNANNRSRLYGNYFIIELILDDNNTDECVEFETLNCKIINNKTI